MRDAKVLTEEEINPETQEVETVTRKVSTLEWCMEFVIRKVQQSVSLSRKARKGLFTERRFLLSDLVGPRDEQGLRAARQFIPCVKLAWEDAMRANELTISLPRR